jgi:hypothetical protein
MIRALTKTFVAVAALVGLAGTANAAFVPATWTDTVAGNTLISAGGSYSYAHNLTDNGFRPLTDIISEFSLSVNIHDDNDSAGEWATVDVANVFGLEDTFSFNFIGNTFNQGTTILGLIQLNALGSLSVTINSIAGSNGRYGDFYFGGSKLVAGGAQYTRQVPEPETLAMFGIGLVGVAAAARRRKAAKA